MLRVGAGYAAALAALVVGMHHFGAPTRGALLGGGLMGFSFVTFWVVARSITEPGRKALAIALGATKVLLYMAFSAAVLSGRVVADAAGFALGVTTFVIVALAVALGTAPVAQAEAES